MTLNTALAATSFIIAVAFGLSTFDRWLRRRKPHEMAWTIAMGLFAVAALALWWAEARGWSSASFRVFFLFGAVINVPWLALGTIFLLTGQRTGRIVTQCLLVFSGFSAGIILTAPMNGTISPNEMPQGSDLFSALPRILAAVGSSIPALIIFGGAIWSAWRVIRGAAPTMNSSVQRQVISAAKLAGGNALIALGAAVLAASGTISGRLGADTAFAVTLVLGIAILFAGFLVASTATHTPTVKRSAELFL
ncbi:MAG: hypothetical protein F2930_05660 [Actinobacteria bacterium]|uniref:Unannotated protein n=1 Tax=freshwater metagenome TaxID=449393 RepID=A0A6J7TFH0_9ZZZZ|nr:hypothetical protein [Actinomycetota bacterium]